MRRDLRMGRQSTVAERIPGMQAGRLLLMYAPLPACVLAVYLRMYQRSETHAALPAVRLPVCLAHSASPPCLPPCPLHMPSPFLQDWPLKLRCLPCVVCGACALPGGVAVTMRWDNPLAGSLREVYVLLGDDGNMMEVRMEGGGGAAEPCNCARLPACMQAQGGECLPCIQMMNPCSN